MHNGEFSTRVSFCACVLIIWVVVVVVVVVVTRRRSSTSTRWHFLFALCCNSNATRAPIANLPNSAQLGSTPYHLPKLHPGPCSSVGMRPRTVRQTFRHTQTHWRAWPIYVSRRLRLTQNVTIIHGVPKRKIRYSAHTLQRYIGAG